MIDKTRFQLAPQNAPDFRVEIRPDPESALELKIRTAEYPAGIIGGAQASDGSYREVLDGHPLAMSGRANSNVTLDRVGEAILVSFSGPGISLGAPLELAIDDYRNLVEHAILSRTGPRTVFL
jgi:hypothetical protein